MAEPLTEERLAEIERRLGTVLREGLLALKADNSPCVWLALSIGDASHYGDVVAVDLRKLGGVWPIGDDGLPSWQAHVDHDIPAEFLEPLSSAVLSEEEQQ